MKKNKRTARKRIPITALMPNLVTMLALFIGAQQFKYAMQSKWSLAVLSVVAAAVLDATDGRLARFLGVASRFGAELDSLSDMAIFGVAPAFVMHEFSLHKLNDRVGWALSILYIICVAIRLARFNTNDIQNKKSMLSKHGFSVGLAAPSCAVSVLFPIILLKVTGYDFFTNQYFCAIVMLFTSFLCVSTIATPTIKNCYIKREQKLFAMLIGALSLIIIYSYTWHSLFCIVTGYYIAIVAMQPKVKKLKANDNIQQIETSNKNNSQHAQQNTNQ